MEALSQQTLKERLQKIRSVIGTAQCIAVTKYTDLYDLNLAISCGLRDFGENRVDELFEKAVWAKEQGYFDVRWHFIGQIQSNKCKKLFEIENLVALHSVDRLSILEKILKIRPHSTVDIYLQVKTSFEAEKAGFIAESEDFKTALALLKSHKDFLFKGLMTMAPIRTVSIEESARKSFSFLRELRDQIQPEFSNKLSLSMGMSGDYQWAIDEGADVVRLGSVLFRGDE